MNLVDALVLKGIQGVGDGSITKILDFTSRNNINSLEELAKFGIQNLPLTKISLSLREFLLAGQYECERLKTKEDLQTWTELGITVTHRSNSKYPRHLLDLMHPPPFLFCRGNISLLEDTRAIAVVGTRNNSTKGAVITQKTIKEFHKRNFIIVSGLALGIDSLAHKAALECGAPTIAVLVDVLNIYPLKNQVLADEILKNDGLLLSENIPGTSTIAALFAKRDRIQAGLSSAVFAIETSMVGGTMFAVRAAREMGRPVFVPDAKAAKYNDLSLDVIQGTQYLAENGEARAYSNILYDKITEELESISHKLKSFGLNEAQEELHL